MLNFDLAVKMVTLCKHFFRMVDCHSPRTRSHICSKNIGYSC